MGFAGVCDVRKILLFLAGLAVFGIGLINLGYYLSGAAAGEFAILPVNVIISIFYIVAWTAIIVYSCKTDDLLQLGFCAVFFTLPLLSSMLTVPIRTIFTGTSFENFPANSWLESFNLVFNAPLFGLAKPKLFTSSINMTVLGFFSSLSIGGVLYAAGKKKIKITLFVMAFMNILVCALINAPVFGIYYRWHFFGVRLFLEKNNSMNEFAHRFYPVEWTYMAISLLYIIMSALIIYVAVKVGAYGVLRFLYYFYALSAVSCLLNFFGSWVILGIPVAAFNSLFATFSLSVLYGFQIFMPNHIFYLIYFCLSSGLSLYLYVKRKKIIDEAKKKRYLHRKRIQDSIKYNIN